MYTWQWFKSDVTRVKAIFLSKELRAVLDGAITEEYVPLIETVKKCPLT